MNNRKTVWKKFRRALINGDNNRCNEILARILAKEPRNILVYSSLKQQKQIKNTIKNAHLWCKNHGSSENYEKLAKIIKILAINIDDDNGYDALSIAHLLINNNPLNKEDKHHKTPLMWCIANNNFRLAKRLIKSGVSVKKHIGMYSAPPLCYAIIHGDRNFIDFLLENGATIWDVSDMGSTVLSNCLYYYRKPMWGYKRFDTYKRDHNIRYIFNYLVKSIQDGNAFNIEQLNYFMFTLFSEYYTLHNNILRYVGVSILKKSVMNICKEKYSYIYDMMINHIDKII